MDRIFMFMKKIVPMLPFQKGYHGVKLNSYKPGILFVGNRQTV